MEFMSELSVIKYLCDYEFYKEHRDKIKLEYLTKELYPVLNVIDGYYRGKDDPVSLTTDDLSNLFFSVPRQKGEYYQEVFTALKANEATKDSTLSLIQGLRQAATLRELSMLAYDASEGRKEVSSVLELAGGLSTNQGEVCDQSEIDDFVSTDLVEIVSTSRSVGGLRWRLDSLNKRLGSLKPGVFGFVFARPETGKTTFLSSEITWMASQLKEEQGPIIWFNNEQVATEVVLRWYQSTLGYTQTDLVRDLEGNRQKFQDLTHGKLWMKDGAQIARQQVEAVCNKYKPSLIVFDQIDKIKGFDNDREDLRLGTIYIWARELAKQYCPVIGVCQADGTGEGQRWLTMANVANAKTSKQAEADWILGIGKVNEAGYDNLRFMHLSKNKLWGDDDTDPKLRHDRWETLLEPNIGRFIDL